MTPAIYELLSAALIGAAILAHGCMTGCASNPDPNPCPRGDVPCGGGLCCPAEDAGHGAAPLQEPQPPATHCDRCLDTYFTACVGCTCEEVDSGTLVECAACPDGVGGVERRALYSCVGVP